VTLGRGRGGRRFAAAVIIIPVPVIVALGRRVVRILGNTAVFVRMPVPITVMRAVLALGRRRRVGKTTIGDAARPAAVPVAGMVVKGKLKARTWTHKKSVLPQSWSSVTGTARENGTREAATRATSPVRVSIVMEC
jgi:hypothetical protein